MVQHHLAVPLEDSFDDGRPFVGCVRHEVERLVGHRESVCGVRLAMLGNGGFESPFADKAR
jgi:hypothetical protein